MRGVNERYRSVKDSDGCGEERRARLHRLAHVGTRHPNAGTGSHALQREAGATSTASAPRDEQRIACTFRSDKRGGLQAEAAKTA